MVFFVNLGRFNEKTRKEEIIGIKGQGIPTEDLRAMITDATECPELIGTYRNYLCFLASTD